jgi:hypothetical protein
MTVEDDPKDVGKEVVVNYLKIGLEFFKILGQTFRTVGIQSGASDTKREWFAL